MDNQHRKISGYRDLTEFEISCINEVKELEADVLDVIGRTKERLVKAGYEPKEAQRTDDAQALRWLATARTDIEKGFMCLVRGIAQPQPR